MPHNPLGKTVVVRDMQSVNARIRFNINTSGFVTIATVATTLTKVCLKYEQLG
jgi:hypothetical protein